MLTAENIKQLIAHQLNCQHLEVDGDGHHWFAVIVSASFAGVRSIKRHQMVYALLKDKLDSNELHALSLRTYTSDEWQKLHATN